MINLIEQISVKRRKNIGHIIFFKSIHITKTIYRPVKKEIKPFILEFPFSYNKNYILEIFVNFVRHNYYAIIF